MTGTTGTWTAGRARRARLDAELSRILRELPRLGVRRAILFGSLVSGRVGPTSDLDLLLVVDSDEPYARRLEGFARALEPTTAVDLFVYTPEEFDALRETNPFVRAAVARGRVVYEA